MAVIGLPAQYRSIRHTMLPVLISGSGFLSIMPLRKTSKTTVMVIARLRICCLACLVQTTELLL